MNGALPLSLYAHFPWCVAKCPYCDFNSHTLRDELPATEYVDALISDLAVAAADVQGRKVTSVFFGGGTPSLFPPDELARFIAAIKQHLSLADDAEITMEANPGAIEHAAFGAYLDAGINRLSLGVQSLNDKKLQALGRIHSAADAKAAFAEARAAGFDNINLDLMYALPGQSEAEALSDVEGVLELAPEHISHYHLTLEPNTVFFANPPQLPDSDLAWEIQASCAEVLKVAGYSNYEVSAWGQPGFECRHNLNYWRYGDYLGVGAGAHAKFMLGSSAYREVRPAHPRAYLRAVSEGAAASIRTLVQPADARFEFMLNNLRLRGGFEIADFERCTGLAQTELEAGIATALERELLQVSAAGQVSPTEHGWRFLDDLQGIFLPDGPD
jgi:putative oxygen-independent coproporphyrinogen III oxidase